MTSTMLFICFEDELQLQRLHNVNFKMRGHSLCQVGNWSRWLTDMFGMDSDDSAKEDSHNSDHDDRQDGRPKSFNLLNDLSDLLMLPKDMLMDRSIRLEVGFLSLFRHIYGKKNAILYYLSSLILSLINFLLLYFKGLCIN